MSNAVAGDGVTVASGSGGLSSADVGTNQITSLGTLTLGGSGATNYNLAGATGAVIIQPLAVTLSGERPYDGTAVASASLLTILTNDDGTNLGLSGTAQLAGPGAGLENIIDFSPLMLTGSAATNYTLEGASGTVTIDPLLLTITPNPTNKAYGQTLIFDPTSFAVSGTLLGSESVSAVTLASPGSAVNAPVAGSPYPIFASGAVGVGGFEASNYQITYNTNLLTVGPLTVILDGSRSYDATTNAEATILSISNAVPGDDVNLASGTAGLASANAGTNVITSLGTLVLGGATSGNYTLAGANGSVVINPLPVTLSGARPYDGTSSVDASLLTILTNYDGTNLSLSGTALLASSGAGLENIVDFSGLLLSGSAATNYTLTDASGTVAIGPIAVILEGARTYDGSTNALATSLEVSNALAGDLVTVASGSGGLASADVGTNIITSLGTLALGGPQGSNYTLAGAGGAVTISPLPVTLTGTRPYDGTNTTDASVLTIEIQL